MFYELHKFLSLLHLSKAGFFTTIQDRGRFHFRNQGVPVSGAMDELAFHWANQLLDNPPDAPVLEITMQGPILCFEQPAVFTLAGARFDAFLDREKIKNWRIYKAEAGSNLVFGKLRKGVRCYLAVKNGFEVPKVMGSASFYPVITGKARLEDGDVLKYKPCTHLTPFVEKIKLVDYLGTNLLEANPGPEFHLLTRLQIQNLTNNLFTVSPDNSRMGYRLQDDIGVHQHTMITGATLPGTVQYTPSGQLIVLMNDGPTTGGYPRILQLTKKGRAVLSQKRAGERVMWQVLEVF